MANSSPKNQIDLVVDFSLGLLSPEQEKVLLTTARSSPELEALLRAQCPDFKGFGNKARAAAAPPAPVVVDLPWHRQRRTWGWSTSVAASVALTVWLAPVSESPQYWLPFDNVLLSQRSQAENVGGLSTGIERYSAGDLLAAVAALKSADVQGANKDLRDIYLASAMINLGRTDEAFKILTSMDLESLPSPWRQYGKDLLKLSSDA
ncbi:MAG: hypothetical protein ACI9UK_000967 [Candidatus Krumholzibacteriia bacterium]